ncbi:class I SAM-dependent methyltransferase [Streptomyces sp. HNM0574]|uniref:class I SAM-dependent methyltransferase n=1 Tax=Streptomyces sp. HNM0574 TaxID=2714954 RepID=UPI00146B31C1|nr:class I SAM-dependent methyltransferase [Streptomyces sp. HNM0574]NLU67382.1 class I SAM-dependent methyltransferase [Streptomyces sp. HNM0574]
MTASATPASPSGTADEGGHKLPRPGSFYDVPGWFYNGDVVLFDWFLGRQSRLDQRGDLLEMGAYMGKSAIMMRSYLRPDETFTVCDLFDSDQEAADISAHNEREMRGSYATLTRRAFEANYLSFHERLPRILQAPTSVVPDEVEDGSCRFVHVDASHMYEHVHPDIDAARAALGEDGLVVLDDFRSEHTPGVSCATWQAVLEGGLRPVCVTSQKFYGTWGDPKAVQDELHAELKERGDCWLQYQDVAGHRLLLVGGRKAAPPPVPASRHAKGTGRAEGQGQRQEAGRGPGGRPRPTLARRAARELLPPIVARPLARALARR